MNIENQITENAVTLRVIDARLKLPPTNYKDLLVRYQYISDKMEIQEEMRRVNVAKWNKKYRDSKKVAV